MYIVWADLLDIVSCGYPPGVDEDCSEAVRSSYFFFLMNLLKNQIPKSIIKTTTPARTIIESKLLNILFHINAL